MNLKTKILKLCNCLNIYIKLSMIHLRVGILAPRYIYKPAISVSLFIVHTHTLSLSLSFSLSSVWVCARACVCGCVCVCVRKKSNSWKDITTDLRCNSGTPLPLTLQQPIPHMGKRLNPPKADQWLRFVGVRWGFPLIEFCRHKVASKKSSGVIIWGQNLIFFGGSHKINNNGIGWWTKLNINYFLTF